MTKQFTITVSDYVAELAMGKRNLKTKSERIEELILKGLFAEQLEAQTLKTNQKEQTDDALVVLPGLHNEQMDLLSFIDEITAQIDSQNAFYQYVNNKIELY